MITHNTMLWKKVMNDILQNNATIGHHEDGSDKMKNKPVKQIKNQTIKIASKWKTKILKANKHNTRRKHKNTMKQRNEKHN